MSKHSTLRPGTVPPTPNRRWFWTILAGAMGVISIGLGIGILVWSASDSEDSDAVANAPLGGGPTQAAGNQPENTANNAAVKSLVPEAVEPYLTVTPTGSVYVPGTQRFGVGLFDERDEPFEQGTAQFIVVKLNGNQGTVTEVLPAPFYPYGISESHEEGSHDINEISGVYGARPTFDAPGPWGVIVAITLADGTVRAGQATFEVAPDSDVPQWGEPAPPSDSLTASTPEEAAEICSATVPDTMHEMSIKDAVTSGRPTVVLFATPTFCSTRTCGPSLETLSELERLYGGSVNFIHIEIYPYDDYTEVTGTVREWSLPSEPWLFMIDERGVVIDRFDGGIGLTELDPLVQQLAT